jgi:hypothetical protein
VRLDRLCLAVPLRSQNLPGTAHRNGSAAYSPIGPFGKSKDERPSDYRGVVTDGGAKQASTNTGANVEAGAGVSVGASAGAASRQCLPGRQLFNSVIDAKFTSVMHSAGSRLHQRVSLLRATKYATVRPCCAGAKYQMWDSSCFTAISGGVVMRPPLQPSGDWISGHAQPRLTGRFHNWPCQRHSRDSLGHSECLDELPPTHSA